MLVNRNHTVAPLSRVEMFPYTSEFRVFKQTSSVIGWSTEQVLTRIQHAKTNSACIQF